MKSISSFSIASLILASLLIFSCGSSETRQVTSSSMTASGEFLFEGPNTLQGNFVLSSEDVAEMVNIDPSDLSAVYISGISLQIETDSVANSVESVLAQLVSDQLPLESLGTLTGLSQTANSLNVKQEIDILPYLADNSSTLIVDANITEDLDELYVSLVFDLTVNY